MATKQAWKTHEKNKMLMFLEPKIKLPFVKPSANTQTNVSALIEQQADCRNAVALCKQGRLKEALNILLLMDGKRIGIESHTYACLLQRFCNKEALPDGKLVHAHMIQTGTKCSEIYTGNTLFIMYIKCGNLREARRAFDEMPTRNVVSWTAMMGAYARIGQSEKALVMYYQMKRTGIDPNHFTFASVLPAVASLAALEQGKEFHEEIIRSGFGDNLFVGSALVDMYVKCGSMEDAWQVFDNMPERNVVSWNAIIAGYVQNGNVDEALRLFRKMPERNVVSLTAVIAGFAQVGCVDEGLALFQKMPGRDVASWNAMIAGYAQNGRLGDAMKLFEMMPEQNVVSWTVMITGYVQSRCVDEALELFDKMPERNVVSWTAMVAGLAQNGRMDEALKLFEKMPERDVVSWNVMIAGYVQTGLCEEALNLFRKMPERDVFSWTAMITGYAQSGHVDEALRLFQEMPARNVVSWTAMISGYSQNGLFDEAVLLFQQMQLTGVMPRTNTFASILPACANLAALEYGKEIHEDIIRNGFQSDEFVGNALIDMYAKCGSIEKACRVFNNLPRRDVVSCTAMIGGYAMHGYSKEALQLFEQMLHAGINPNHVTFVGVLSACCHSGLVDDGWQYFNCMKQYYHITPTMDHYCCMVDLLGRAGQLNEAQDFVNKMPVKPNAAVLGSLLGACKIHINVELAERVAEYLFELDPENAAPYVLLSNIYAAGCRWDGMEKVRRIMKERRVRKKPGCSWIEVNKRVSVFLVGEITPTNRKDMYKVGEFSWEHDGNSICA